MALSTNYGKLSIPKVGADEPVFILRAQDKLAETAIDIYRVLSASHGEKKTGKVLPEESIRNCSYMCALLKRPPLGGV
ncbi:MAG: hypothetical protein R6X07_14140 [Desulfatiglandales bacterium]|jgi:hypothetical protein